MSYRIDTSGAAVVINRETGVITSAGSFVGEGGQRYTSQVEAYDNEGNDPSNSNFITLLVSNNLMHSQQIAFDIVLCL